MVIYASCELLAALVGREHISEEDIAVGTNEIDLTPGCLFVDGPFSDESVGFLRLDGQEMFAGIVEHPYFLLDAHEDTHFGQLDLVDVEIVHVVPVLGPPDGSVVANGEERQVVQAGCAKHVPI